MFLSIIIPVYNTKDYIEECINSCVNQDIDKSDYEIICVDDGSTDGTAEILDNYKCENLKVIHQSNQGVSVARNKGIEAAQGDYIWFVDADDMIGISILKMFKEFLEKNECDQLYFGTKENIHEYIYKITEEKESLQPNIKKDGVVWIRFFRREFLLKNNILFLPNVVIGEDLLFLFEVDYHLPRNETVPVNRVYIYRRRHSKSAMANIRANRKFEINGLLRYKYYYDRYDFSDDKMSARVGIRFFSTARRQFVLASQLPKEEAKECKKILKENNCLYIRPSRKLKKLIWEYNQDFFRYKIYYYLFIHTNSRIGWIIKRTIYYFKRLLHK